MRLPSLDMARLRSSRTDFVESDETAPDCRYLYCRALLAQGFQEDPRGDTRVTQMLQFLQQLLEDDAWSKRLELRVANPTLYAVLAVKFAGADLRRLYIECGTLSRAPTEEVAKITGLSEDVVRAYEYFFYDVRDMLDYPGMVQSTLLAGATTLRDWRDSDRNTAPQMTRADVVRSVAYLCGWTAVEVLLDYHTLTEEAAEKLYAWWRSNEALKLIQASTEEQVTLLNRSEVATREWAPKALRGSAELMPDLSVQAWREQLAEILIRPQDPTEELPEKEPMALLPSGSEDDDT